MTKYLPKKRESSRVNFRIFQIAQCTLWKNEKITLTKIIFRQINSLVIYSVNVLLSRNFCQKHMRLNFRNFHTVQCGHILRFWNLWWTKINRKRSWCSRLKKAEREFLQIPHWSVIWLFSSHKKKKSVKLAYGVSLCIRFTEFLRKHGDSEFAISKI